MIKSLQNYKMASRPLFLAPKDEICLENRLKEIDKNICYIDDPWWTDEKPPSRSSISECQSKTVLIWDPTIVPHLPSVRLPNGLFEGPQNGYVLRLIRSRLVNNTLLSGEAMMSYLRSNENLNTFFTLCWKAIIKLNASALDGFDYASNRILDKNVKTYIVGEGVKELASQGVRLKHDSVDVYYKIHYKIPEREPEVSQ